jgi:hypothetical protein
LNRAAISVSITPTHSGSPAKQTAVSLSEEPLTGG